MSKNPEHDNKIKYLKKKILNITNKIIFNYKKLK